MRPRTVVLLATAAVMGPFVLVGAAILRRPFIDRIPPRLLSEADVVGRYESTLSPEVIVLRADGTLRHISGVGSRNVTSGTWSLDHINGGTRLDLMELCLDPNEESDGGCTGYNTSFHWTRHDQPEFGLTSNDGFWFVRRAPSVAATTPKG